MSTRVKCPTCQRAVNWTASSAFRPFCSDHCRLIDLGEWASEKHSIPGEAATSIETLIDEQDTDDYT